MSVYIENFETIFGVKNNIQALRNKVLELAFQGKLVEQDANDEPASTLVNKIKIEREELVKQGKINKQKPLPEIIDDEKIFNIPDNWEWVRLNEILDVRDGTHDTPKYVPSGYPLVTSKNLDNGKLNFDNIKYISQNDYNTINQRSGVENGDILFAMIGSIGNPVIVGQFTDFAIKNVALIKNLPNKDTNIFYLYYYLLKEQETIKMVATGGVQAFISLSYLRNYIIPIPPLSEQCRIVEKIEALMSKIDSLEESLHKKEQLIELLPKAVVDAVGRCQTGEELKEQLQFVIENFEDIFKTPKSMQELRNVVLQLAIEGKLVTQDPNDEPISELVKQIKAEKDQLIKQGEIKKEKPLPKIEEDEIHFEIPASWEWVRLPFVTYFQEGPGIMKKDFREKGVPLIRIAGMHSDTVSLDGCNYLDTEMVENKWKHFKLELDDIVLSSSASIGKIAKVDESTVGCIPYTGLIRFKMLKGLVDKYFIYFVLSSTFINQINNLKSGATIQHFGPTHLYKMIIPLPPVNEQIRIVQKVEAIMNLIDQIENKLNHKSDLVEKMISI